MNSDDVHTGPTAQPPGDRAESGQAKTILDANIGQSIDMLVEYLVDNDVTDIHRLIMGEVEKRLLIKVLERSRGNKRQAAKQLGMSRNTFHRKISKLTYGGVPGDVDSES